MKKIKMFVLFAFLFLFLPHSAKAQVPIFDCSKSIQVYTDVTTGNLYACKISAGVGTWMLIGGGTGSVTHTGNLTALHLMLGNGLADSTVDSACVTNGTGALSGCTSISAGSGASAAGATATGGFACVEGASTGWTPTVGQDYQRCDSTSHTFVCSNNGNAEGACGGGTPSFPVTVGGTVTSGGVPYFNSTVQESSSALLAANALMVGGGAGAAPATGNGDFTYASHTLTGAAAGIVDLSAETGFGFLLPVNATNPNGLHAGYVHINSVSGFMSFDGGGSNFVVGLAGTGGTTSTNCTNQVLSAISSNGPPTCHTIVGADMGNTLTLTGAHSSATYLTATNCSSSASPAVCGSAAAGSVAVPTGVTPTLVVNTTAVTANSQILFTPDESLGTKLSVTCNSTIAQVAIEPIVTARTAATSFTIQYNTTITVNPICLSYLIVN